MTNKFDTIMKILNTSDHDGYDDQFDDAPSHRAEYLELMAKLATFHPVLSTVLYCMVVVKV